MPASERPARESLAQRVARELGTAILRGRHPPGTVLPTEEVLCAAYRVGRNVLREAIKTLVGKRLLETRQRAGTIVQPRARWNLLDLDVLLWMVSDPGLRHSLLDEITQLRLMLEPEVAALAAQHARDEQITALDRAYARMERERLAMRSLLVANAGDLARMRGSTAERERVDGERSR